MTYQQAGRIAIVKRISGWVIFIPALLSTVISILKLMHQHNEKSGGLSSVLLDMTHVMVEMARFNTPFLNLFWENSPLPDFRHQVNLLFWVIYGAIFIGLALQASGARMGRQAKFLREQVEDRLILERALGAEGLTKAELDAKIVMPRHSIFLQFFPLYVLPAIVIIAGYFFFSRLGFL